MTNNKNCYRLPEGYLLDPFQNLYTHSDDIELSSDPAIRELCEYALTMSGKIAGDFDMDYLTSSLRGTRGIPQA